MRFVISVDHFNEKVMGDATRVRQVVLNLLSNATKFTHQGSILIMSRATVIDEKQRRMWWINKWLKSGIAISVTDTGIGIPQDRVKERLFRAFSQVDSTTTRKYGGTGLGLAISKKLALLMGGDLFVASEVGKGSTFTFDFVASLADEDEIPRPLTAQGSCFIYDSWEISRQVFVAHFTSFGFDCICVDSLAELCEEGKSALLVVSELEKDVEIEKSKFKTIPAKFRIAVCRLRSPNEVRTEDGINALISRHIKRDSLRNIVEQLLTSGSTVQPSSRHIPYYATLEKVNLGFPISAKMNRLGFLWPKTIRSYTSI